MMRYLTDKLAQILLGMLSAYSDNVIYFSLLASSLKLLGIHLVD